MSEERPPAEIGQARLRMQVSASDGPQPSLGPRLARALFIGLLFSVIPIMLTNLVLKEGNTSFHPTSLVAAVPVVAVAFWLLRPRDRWYAVGDAGFALGERFFGQVRWDRADYAEIESVAVDVRRVSDGQGQYRFTGYRFTFDGGRKKRFVLEGEVQETPPRGTEVHLPTDEELPAQHELRFARLAASTWAERTGRRVETAAATP